MRVSILDNLMGRLLVLASFLSACPLWAEGEPFSVSAPSAEVEAAETVNKLRCQAVENYLKKSLGDSYGKYDRFLKCETLEKFILDYRKGRSATDRNLIEVTGHLDDEALKKWMRGLQAKLQPASAPAITLVYSSSLPSLPIRARDSAAKARELPMLQSILSIIAPILQKESLRNLPTDLSSLSLEKPPHLRDEIAQLHEGVRGSPASSLLWIHFSPGANAIGARMETSLYNLSADKILYSRSDELALDNKDLHNGPKIRGLLGPYSIQFQKELDELVASGLLNSRVFDLVVDGIDSMPLYGNLEASLNRIDVIGRVTPIQAGAKTAVFEIWSSVSSEEIANRLNGSDAGGKTLRTGSIDPRTIRMRYLKE